MSINYRCFTSDTRHLLRGSVQSFFLIALAPEAESRVPAVPELLVQPTSPTATQHPKYLPEREGRQLTHRSQSNLGYILGVHFEF